MGRIGGGFLKFWGLEKYADGGRKAEVRRARVSFKSWLGGFFEFEALTASGASPAAADEGPRDVEDEEREDANVAGQGIGTGRAGAAGRAGDGFRFLRGIDHFGGEEFAGDVEVQFRDLDPYAADEVGADPFVLHGILAMQIGGNACRLKLAAQQVGFLRGGKRADGDHVGDTGQLPKESAKAVKGSGSGAGVARREPRQSPRFAAAHHQALHGRPSAIP